jgi:hypothetical protein
MVRAKPEKKPAKRFKVNIPSGDVVEVEAGRARVVVRNPKGGFRWGQWSQYSIQGTHTLKVEGAEFTGGAAVTITFRYKAEGALYGKVGIVDGDTITFRELE